MKVRELADADLIALVEMAMLAPRNGPRFAREIIARLRKENELMNGAATSRYQDSAMALRELHEALGKVVHLYIESLPTKVRLALNLSAMTPKEKVNLITILLREDDEEEGEE